MSEILHPFLLPTCVYLAQLEETFWLEYSYDSIYVRLRFLWQKERPSQWASTNVFSSFSLHCDTLICSCVEQNNGFDLWSTSQVQVGPTVPRGSICFMPLINPFHLDAYDWGLETWLGNEDRHTDMHIEKLGSVGTWSFMVCHLTPQ